MKEKIFITGISSDLMQEFVKHINKDQYTIYGLTRNQETVGVDSKIKYVIGDIKNTDRFKDILKNCSILIHAAAVTHSFSDKKYFEVNLEATKKLISVANSCKVKKFVLISSNTAGEKSGTYGLTKYLSEKYLEDHHDNWLILKPAEVYGGSKKKGIEKFIANVFQSALVLYPTGVPARLFPVFIEDVAEIMHTLILKEKKTNEKITICGPKGYTLLEIIHLIAKLREEKIAVLPIPRLMMLLAEKITNILPFYVGVIPDQIPRLYSLKNIGSTEYRKGTEKLENYLKTRLRMLEN